MGAIYILSCLIVYVISFFIDLTFLGYVADAPFYTRLTYMFTHITFIHFAINMFSFHILFTILRHRVGQFKLFVAMLIGAFLASFGSEMPLPTIGASGVVFFLLGVYTMYYFNKRLIIVLVLSFIINALTYQYFKVNAIVHFLGFTYGVAFFIIFKLLNSFKINK